MEKFLSLFLNFTPIGLTLLLIAWGTKSFWLSKWEGSIKSLEFLTITLSINHLDSDLKFMKYIVTGKEKPSLLADRYWNELRGLKGAMAILGRAGAKLPDDLTSKRKTLESIVYDAKTKNLMIDESVHAEVLTLNDYFHKSMKIWAKKSRNQLQIANKINIAFYVLGSSLLILGEIYK